MATLRLYTTKFDKNVHKQTKEFETFVEQKACCIASQFGFCATQTSSANGLCIYAGLPRTKSFCVTDAQLDHTQTHQPEANTIKRMFSDLRRNKGRPT